MCGIAGFYGDFSPELLRRMAAALAHRGPDGEGFWHDGKLGIGFAHRRLSLIDLTDAASQPMASVNGRYQVVFNGEIYNFKTLAKLPELKGYSFNRNSDTATLAPLYDVHGPAMLQRLEGMFAFALADTHTGTLFIARDHAGIKPLYYAQTPTGVLFASELKALAAVAAAAGIDLSPDPTALQEYVSFLWTPSVRTPVAGIRKLRPGHCLKLSRGQAAGQGGKVEIKMERWWQPPAFAPARGAGVTPQALATLWDEIVAEQCTADVPPGAFLSGGVDSSAVVASMVATGHAPVQTYCIGFKGTGMAAEGFGDDAHYANLMAQHAKVPLQTLQVEVDDTLAQLPQLAWLLDEPTADPAPLFVTAISNRARADGLKLLMSGTGGDDVLTGYRRHQSARLREMLGSLGYPAGGLCAALARLAPRGALRRRLERLGGLLGGADDDFLLNAFLTNSQPDAATLVRAGESAAHWGDELRATIAESAGLPLVERLLRAEGAGFLPDHNLNYGDKAGMAAGIEIRVPFTDRRLMQFMAQVPSHDKMMFLQPKAFFKHAMRGRVPDAILDRSKTGFGAPLRTWMQHSGKRMLEPVVMNCDAQRFDVNKVRNLWQRTLNGQVDGSYTILAIAMTEWWFAALKSGSAQGSKPL